MKVYGLDFTSKPSSTKCLTLAHCTLAASMLTVEKLEALNTDTEGDFSKVASWLEGSDPYGREWVAGIDFPFGLPVGAIAHFKWLSEESDQDWAAWVTNMYAKSPTLTEFQDLIESWEKTNMGGIVGQVHICRQTDHIGSKSISSPLKVRDMPPIGSMFYQGARLLLNCGASIYPVRVNEDKRRIVESYPALVAKKFVARNRYKDAKKSMQAEATAVRTSIIESLEATNVYGLTIAFSEASGRKECVEDHSGDKMDSVLCAVQAAWSASNGYGIPSVQPTCFQNTISIEGWMADPELLKHFE